MKNLARIGSLAATLCLGIPATGFSHDHDHGHGGGSWGHGNYYSHGNYYHGGHYYYGSHVHFYGGYFPFYASYPYYSAPYYDTGYYDSYYDGPAYGASISSAPAYRDARVEDRGDNLAIDVQRALRREGFYHGSIDGDVGAGTRAAIRQYQYDHNLEVTGRIDRSLVRSLGLD